MPESQLPLPGDKQSVPGRAPTVMPTALVVQPSVEDALACMTALSTLGFAVTVAGTFGQARTAVAAGVPRVLVTDIRLGQYNGLHLVLRARSAESPCAAIVTSRVPDPVLQQEAEHLNATFVLMPTSVGDLTAAVLRTLFRSGTTATPIRPPFERRHIERRERPVPVGAERRGTDRRRPITDLIRATQ